MSIRLTLDRPPETPRRRRRRPSGRSLAALLMLLAGSSVARAGSFSDVIPWSEIPIHAALLPDGKVMTFGATPQDAQGGYDYDIWDPSKGTGPNAHISIPNGITFESFCVGGVLNPADTSILLAGGRSNQLAAKYDYRQPGLSTLSPLKYPRYYATVTTLPDGRILITGGANAYGTQATASSISEIYTPGKGWQTLPGTANSPMRQSPDQLGTGYPFWYPHVFTTAFNDVFAIGGKYTWRINYAGQGSISDEKVFNGTNYGATSTAVMYRPGLVLQIGGGSSANDANDGHPGSNVATIFDLRTRTVPTRDTFMRLKRHFPTATVLANGEVLVTGGSEINNKVENVAYRTEIYNPDTNQWRLDAAMQTPRLYHSLALLLKDGRVMVGGGGSPGPFPARNIEIYTPDYLLDSTGNPAVRPSILSAPGRVSLGQSFGITVDKPVKRMTLVKTGVVTHSFNTDQRFFDLTFAAANNGYTVTFPNDAANATPGLYMLFAFDQNGVPSVGKYIRLPSPIGDDGKSAPNDMPTSTAPTGTPLPITGSWEFCSADNQICSVTGQQQVRYGAQDRFSAPKTITDSIACNAGVFGDPAPGIAKSCQVLVAKGSVAVPGSSTYPPGGSPPIGTLAGTVAPPWAASPSPARDLDNLLPVMTASTLVSGHSGLCLAPEGNSDKDNARIVQMTCNNSPQQKWQLVAQGNGYAVKNVYSGKCLDVQAFGMGDGVQTFLWGCWGSTNQTWIPKQTQNGLSLVASHSGKCLDVWGRSTKAGDPVGQWTCIGSINQVWRRTDGGMFQSGTSLTLQAITACCSTRYIRHQAEFMDLALLGSAADVGNATWIARPGLGKSSCVTFESGNSPGYFLRQRSFTLYTERNDATPGFAADATFCPVPGLSGKGTSLQSLNYPNKYIRHYYWKLYLSSNGGDNAWDAQASFSDDVSWNVLPPPPPSASFSFQAATPCCTSQYLRHQAADVDLATISTVTDQWNAMWIMRPGLGRPTCVTFESTNSPGYYLRHRNFRMMVELNDGTPAFAADATFCPVAGLNGRGTSFQSINYPDKYIRQYYWRLHLSANGGNNPWDTQISFTDDATWVIAQPPTPR